MSTQTAIASAPPRHIRPYGISALLHFALAAIVLGVFLFKTSRTDSTNRTIELWPDTAAPAENTLPDIPPIVGAEIKPLPPLRNVEPETYSQVTPSLLDNRMTEQQFRERYGRLSPQNKNNAITPPKPLPTSDTIKTPVVDNIALSSLSSPTTDTHIQNQMESYFALLAQRIRQVQEKPEGLGSELVVRIEFQVHADGTVGAVKIVRSSGNDAFDNSVVKAIRSVRPIGARPDGKSGVKTADFRMREES